MNRNIISYIFLFASMFSLSVPVFGIVNTTNLRSEYKQNPMGILTLQPRLSWEITGSERNIRQVAWQIKAAASISDLKIGKNLLWDTKKVLSDQSIQIEYQGRPLQSRDKVYWQVKVTTNKGDTPWSEIASFEMGLLTGTDWEASWIQPDVEEDADVPRPASYLRKVFSLKGHISQARIYASAQGIYQLSLNGQKVSDELFTPGWTSYNNRIQYQIYDVSQLLKSGDNALGIILGDGWFRGNIFGRKNFYGNKLSAILQLEIIYTDGSRKMIITDNSWKSNTGAILKSDFYDGETYDARKELIDWDKMGYTDTHWKNVIEKDINKDLLVASESMPTRITQTIRPIRKIITPKNELVLDFGQNITGWVAFTLTGKKSERIRMQFAETLDGDGNFFRENLRTAKAEDEYIFRGEGVETYEPHFTFHGFRYMKITEYTGEVRLEDFTGKVIHTDVHITGQFTCSDTLVNKLVSNIHWSALDNFLDIPTDCPQRDERMGWTADVQVFTPTACYLANVAPFFNKWLKDLAIDQRPNGGVYDIVPNVRTGDRGNGASGWGDAAIIVPWALYRVYGDKTLLSSQYESMKRWVEYLKTQSGETFIYHGGEFGDWLAFTGTRGDYPGATTDKDLVGTAYFAHSTQLLARAARALGKIPEAEEYEALFHRIRNAFQKEFITSTGRLSSNTQTAYVLALSFGLLPDSMRKGAAERLAADVKKFGHITTGFLGTPDICNILSEYGYNDIAYMLLFRKKYPSWLYPVTMGATTVWERWDSILPDGSFNKGSLNHYAFGAIGNWLFERVGGVSQADNSVGYKEIVIRPIPTKELSYARTEYYSIHGRISSYWRMSGNSFELEVEIPANTSARAYLPTADVSGISESGKALHQVADIRMAGVEDGYTVVEICSGNYSFSFQTINSL